MAISLFLCGLGMAFIIEGIFYFAMASRMKRIAELLPSVPERTWRAAGLAAMGLGLLIVYLFRPHP